MSFSLDVLNTIRSNASADYQARIPEATRTNFASIGQAFETYTPLYNEFCASLLNRIGLTLFEQATFSNKLAPFKLGEMTSAQDVQEIFVSMAQAEGQYDPAGPNPLGRRDPAEVAVTYHRQNRRDKYVMSIGDLDFRRNFTSPATLDAFLSAQLNSIYTADAYDEWVMFKHLLATYSYNTTAGGKKSYFEYEVPLIDGANNATACKQFVKTLKKAVQDQTFMSDQFNAAGVKRKTADNNFALLIHKDLLPEIDVELLMTAFNPGKASISPTIITLDDFDELTKDKSGNPTYGLLVEKDFPRIWDTVIRSEQIRNPDGLFTNTFYHHHQILSLSPFKNAVRLVGKASA